VPEKVWLYNQVEGRKVQVTTDEATQRIRDPAFLVLDDTEFTVVDPWGQKFGAKGAEVYKWMADSRYRLETAAEERQRYLDENYGGLGGAAAAGVLGAARGASLGITDLAATATGLGDMVADIAEAHPTISTVGEIGGGVAAALASGGAGGAGLLARGGRAVAAPGIAAVKGGQAAAAAVESALRAGTTLEKGAVVMGRAVGMAAEGAAFGGGAAMSEALLGDPDAAATDILADWAAGATTGAALGGVIGFAAGLPTLARRAEKVLAPAAGPADEEGLKVMLSEVTGRDIAPETVGQWSKLNDKFRKAAFQIAHGKNKAEAARIYGELIDSPVKRVAATMDDAVAKSTDDVLPLWKDAEDAFEQAINAPSANKSMRVARIALSAPQMSEGAAVARFGNPLGSLRKVLASVREDAKDVGHRVVQKELGVLGAEIEGVEREFVKAASRAAEGEAGALAMQYTDRIGEILNKGLGKFRTTGEFVSRPQAYLEPLQSARREYLKHLTDPDIYGEAATKMGELRQAANGVLSFRDGVRKRLFATVRDDKLLTKKEVYRKKLKTFMGQIGDDPENNIDVGNVFNYFKGMQNQLRVNKSLLSLTGEERALYARAEKSAEAMLKRLEAWRKAAKIRADFKALSKISGFNLGGITAGRAQAVGGLGLLGTLVTDGVSGGVGAGMWMLGSALKTINRPAQYIRQMDQLHASRRIMQSRVAGAAAGLVGRAVTPAIGQVAASKVRAKKPKREELPDVLDGLSQITSGGPSSQAHLVKLQGPVRDLAPTVAASMAKTQYRAAEFLEREAGALGLATTKTRWRSANPQATAKWWRMYEMVNDPMTHILGPLSRGRVHDEALKVLQEVYPSLLESIREATWQSMGNRQVLDVSTASKLSRILGVSLNDVIGPGTVRVLQNAQKVLNPSENPQVPGSGRPADADLTAAQRLQAR